MPEPLLLQAPQEGIIPPQPDKKVKLLHEGEVREYLLLSLKNRLTCSLNLIGAYKRQQIDLDKEALELEKIGIYVRRGDGGIIMIHIPLDPNIALEGYQIMDLFVQRFKGEDPSLENAQKTGSWMFEHESKHYGLAAGVASTPIYYSISIVYDPEKGTTTFNPNVLVNEASFSPSENMHISAAPNSDMSIPDKVSAEHWADILAAQLRKQQLQ